MNRYFNFSPTTSYQQYYFNLIQQPVNAITGYERQHRKNWSFVPVSGADPKTTDQYTKLITNVANRGNIFDQRSKAKELATVAGLCLLQPYLDYSGNDAAQGELKIKVWEYNSFLIDPYFRAFDMSDCQFIWCQEYISKKEAEDRFQDKIEVIAPMAGTPQRYGSFYFLPENYNMCRNDLMVLSYVWYKWKGKKKKLYSKKRNQFFDLSPNADTDALLYNIPDFELVTVDGPVWRLAVVLNDQLMFQGDNPLGDFGCPFVPYWWIYEPHINYYDLRVRSLVRTMRDPQFLLNYKIITNNDIAAATINAGWKRKVGAVANEDNLKKSGQGWDIVINEGYELTDCEKIIPSAVPESDLALAQQMDDFIWKTSGFNLENWSGQQDKQISSLTMMLKQAANLMIFQKFFDQWDCSDKLLGEKMLKIALNNWEAEKISLYIGEEPTPFFYSKIFTEFQIVVEESDLTPTQQNLQAQNMLDINSAFQREVFPPSMIIPKLNITGKGEIIPFLQQQEQQAQQMQQEQQIVQHMAEDAKIKELYSRATNNIAMARERHGRSEADIGLFEERLSEITHNRAMATKAKMEALEKLVDVIAKYGEIETALQMNNIQSFDYRNESKEDEEKIDAKQTALSNQFVMSIMGNNNQQGSQTAQMG